MSKLDDKTLREFSQHKVLMQLKHELADDIKKIQHASLFLGDDPMTLEIHKYQIKELKNIINQVERFKKERYNQL